MPTLDELRNQPVFQPKKEEESPPLTLDALRAQPAVAPEKPQGTPADATLDALRMQPGDSLEEPLGSPTLGDYFGGLELLTVLPKAFAPDLTPRKGVVDFANKAGEAVVQAGQSLQEGLLAPSPLTAGGKRDIRGKLLSQALDITGQTISAPIEQFGALGPKDNATFSLARIVRDATRTPQDEVANEGLPEQFSRGVFQLGSFYFGGGVATKLFGTSRKVATAAAAWLGSAVGGQAGAEDAKAYGATDEQIATARKLNEVLGLTEGLPVGMAIGRIDDLTGGFLSRRLKGKAAEITADALTGAIEEGLQEFGQTLGENFVASDLAGYDPTRSISANVAVATGMGGSLGFLANLVTASLGVRNRTRFQNQVEQDLQDLQARNTGPLINMDEATRGLLNKRVEAQQAIGKLAEGDTKELQTAANEALNKAEENLSYRLARQEFRAGELVLPEEQAAAINKPRHDAERQAVNNIVLNQALEGKGTVAERLKTEPIVIGLTREARIRADMKGKLQAAIKAVNEDSTLTAAEKVNQTKADRAKLEQINHIEDDLLSMAKDVKSFLASVKDLIGANKIVVSDSVIAETGSKAAGNYFGMEINGEIVNVINLDLDEYARAVGSLAKNTEARKNHLDYAKARVFSTLTHEVGHAVAYNNFQKLFRKVLAGKASESESKLISAIRAGYNTFLKDSVNVPYRQGMSARDSLMSAMFEGGFINGEVKSGLPLEEMAKNFFLTYKADAYGNEFSTVEAQDGIGQDLSYWYSVREYFAEEFSKIVQDEENNLLAPDALPFFKDAIENIRSVLRQHPGKFRTTNEGMKQFFVEHSLRTQLEAAVESLNKNVIVDPITALEGEGLLSSKQAEILRDDQVKFNKFYEWGLNILQIAEKNPGLTSLQSYVRHMEEWKNEVNSNIAIANQRLIEWKNLGKEENENLARLLTDETIGRLPDGGWLAEPRTFTAEEIAKYNLSDKALELRENIKKDMAEALNQMEEVLVAAKKRIFAEDELVQGREILKVRKDFRDMRSRPFFPLMRFGKYTIEVRANGEQRLDGRDYKDKAIVEFLTFDTKKERNKAYAQIQRQYVKGSVVIGRDALTTPNFSLQGMPLTMLEHLESRLEAIELPKEAKEQIAKLKNDVLPFKSFRKHFQRRKRIAGYSVDGQRAYANYMTSFSNHIARVKFDHLFKEDLENLEATRKAVKARGGDATKHGLIQNYINEHLEYVMNPVDEFVGLRSAAFFWFLGFNVKSAFINLSQIPFLTYPYLAARYGDGKAVAQITRSFKTAITAMRDARKLSPGISSLIDQGMAEDWLDESLATELALAASEKNLDKSLPRKWRQQAWLKTSYYGSLPFHLAEKFNRHATAIAAYQLETAGYKSKLSTREIAKLREQLGKIQEDQFLVGEGKDVKNSKYPSISEAKNKEQAIADTKAALEEDFANVKRKLDEGTLPPNHKDAVAKARAAVKKTQFEYARYARSKFMRGKVGGTVFVFQNYMQNVLYFMLGGDRGALRAWIMLFLVAGLQGLPFGENIMDIYDFVVRKGKEKLGMKDPDTQVRRELREVLDELDVNPDLVLHGLSSSSFGLGNVGEFMGWPIPSLDLSASLSLGRAVPGTELLQPGKTDSFDQTLAEGTERVGGAAVSGLVGIGRAIADNHPDQWKRWERAMPAAMRNVSKAVRFAARGGERTRGNKVIAELDWTDPRDLGEIVGQALGFAPRDVTLGWEGFISQQQSVNYYKTWSTSLLLQWNHARYNEDKEGVQAANEAIREYNRIVPYGEMKIGPESRRNSYESYIRTRVMNGMDIEQSKKFRRLSSESIKIFKEDEEN